MDFSPAIYAAGNDYADSMVDQDGYNHDCYYGEGAGQGFKQHVPTMPGFRSRLAFDSTFGSCRAQSFGHQSF